jgi:hypothetical protein
MPGFLAAEFPKPELVGPFSFMRLPEAGRQVSSGTLRPVDLLQASWQELDYWIARNEVAWWMFVPAAERKAVLDLLRNAQGILDRTAVNPDRVNDPEWNDEACEAICDIDTVINERFTRMGTYFGSHEGDGAAIGYWPLNDHDLGYVKHHWTPDVYWHGQEERARDHRVY